ncbi:MAG: DEAD/DEAH box helicase [Bacillota bacterium]|nr:DEAD/DEAH box helicase [Bacillota bacterium]
MDLSFQDLGLNENLIKGLTKEEITAPTEIQTKAIPKLLENKDIIGQSETGSGKTLTYLLPIFQKIKWDKREMQAVILAPTHELVMQIDREIKLLAENSNTPVTSISIIGNVNIKRQIEKLREKPHILVGSAGRILELIKLRKINAQTVKTIVIDEGDKLLDENNIDQVKAVIKTTMKDRQLMIFSATIREETIDIAKNLMKLPEIIKIDEMSPVNQNIVHNYLTCEQRDKIVVLRKLIAALNPVRAIVFINKSDEIEITVSKLKFHKLNAYGIYGNAPKEERKKAMEDFRNGKLQILVASDLAARGLDIKDVTYIFNLDLPEDPKEYLHRAGRTGRCGENGIAITLVTEYEIPIIKRYEKAFNIKIEEKYLYKGNLLNGKRPL